MSDPSPADATARRVAGWRSGERFGPLAAKIAAAGRRCVARPLHARMEAEITAPVDQAIAIVPACPIKAGVDPLASLR